MAGKVIEGVIGLTVETSPSPIAPSEYIATLYVSDERPGSLRGTSTNITVSQECYYAVLNQYSDVGKRFMRRKHRIAMTVDQIRQSDKIVQLSAIMYVDTNEGFKLDVEDAFKDQTSQIFFWG